MDKIEIAKTTFSRYLHAYRPGGIEKLHEVSLHRRQSQLTDYRTSIEADFRQRPPATVAEAAARMAPLTGLERRATQVRQFCKALGMQPRKVGQMPAKADVVAQEECKTGQREPCLVPCAVITPRVLSTAGLRISQSVSFWCKSTESVSDDN